MTATIEQKFLRNLNPVMSRALDCAEKLRKYPFEQIDAREYVRLELVVQDLEKFLNRKNGKDRK